MKEMLEAYAAAVRSKDVDGFLGLYAGDVRTFDLWSEWSYDGKSALREMVAEWFGSLGTDVVAVEFDEVRSQTGDDVAAVSAFTTYRGLTPQGGELRSMKQADVGARTRQRRLVEDRPRAHLRSGGR